MSSIDSQILEPVTFLLLFLASKHSSQASLIYSSANICINNNVPIRVMHKMISYSKNEVVGTNRLLQLSGRYYLSVAAFWQEFRDHFEEASHFD